MLRTESTVDWSDGWSELDDESTAPGLPLPVSPVWPKSTRTRSVGSSSMPSTCDPWSWSSRQSFQPELDDASPAGAERRRPTAPERKTPAGTSSCPRRGPPDQQSAGRTAQGQLAQQITGLLRVPRLAQHVVAPGDDLVGRGEVTPAPSGAVTRCGEDHTKHKAADQPNHDRRP